MSSSLQLFVINSTEIIGQRLHEHLSAHKYVLHQRSTQADWLGWLSAHHQQIDCLILEAPEDGQGIFDQLKQAHIFLPVVVLLPSEAEAKAPTCRSDGFLADRSVDYHRAVIWGSIDQLSHLNTLISQAIQEFVALPIASELPLVSGGATSLPTAEALAVQKERLTDKLKARLGYLGIYYKRNPENFFRNMRQADREELLHKLQDDYRAIILMYFSKDSGSSTLNSKIDEFVNQAFFADISVSQIVEIHMDLMDEFSKQLLLEGRSDEILLDYRLTLIDVIAHLCEMYRRSIPREP